VRLVKLLQQVKVITAELATHLRAVAAAAVQVQ
jgi:hypothetical protein